MVCLLRVVYDEVLLQVHVDDQGDDVDELDHDEGCCAAKYAAGENVVYIDNMFRATFDMNFLSH
jgi:hypothetical protein